MSRLVEAVVFPGALGHPLKGRLHHPVGPVVGVALFAHCFTCSKDLHAARRIAASLAERGFRTLRFDFTGLGQSEGDFADTTFSSDVEDLIAAAAWLRETHQAPSLLVGHSLGGAAVLRAAARIEACTAVATVGAPSDPEHVLHVFAPEEKQAICEGEAMVSLAGRSFTVKRAFIDDLATHPLTEDLPTLRKAILVLHSPQDQTVGVEHARALFQAARHPKSFVSLDGADHLLSRAEDAEWAGEVIAGWAMRYAGKRQPVPAAVHQDDVEVATAAGGFATNIIARGRHRFRADEPLSLGGTDTGPTPYELLSASLGACTTMTLRMYARRKAWPLEDVIVHVIHAKIDGVDTFERVLHLEGDLDEAQKARCVEIADRCPVHRTLHNDVVVTTALGRP